MKRLNKVQICEIKLNSQLDVDDVRNNYVITTDTYESIFIENMYKLKDYVEESATYESFASFWATYSSMNDKQRKYYFYWRNQYRLGNNIKTDVAYIYILVYELLEGIGWEKEIDGFYELKKVWDIFRECSDGFACDLELWIYDFVINRKLEQEVNTDLYDIIIHSKISLLINIYLEHIQSDINAEITWDILKKLFLYDCSKEMIFQGEMKEYYQNIIIKIMSNMNQYYHRYYQKSVFDYYLKEAKRKEKHFIYANAVKSKNQYCYLEYKLYTESLELKSFLTKILKHSINMLRKMYGYRGKLHIETIEAEYMNIIQECVETQKKSENVIKPNLIVVDENELNQMRAEAQDIIEMLTVEEQEEQLEKTVEDTKEVNNIKNVLPKYETTEAADNLIDFLNVLNEYQIKIIHILLETTEVAIRLNMIEKENNIMIDSSIDEINELFYDFFDDILINIQDGIPCICNEYEHILMDKLKNNKT